MSKHGFSEAEEIGGDPERPQIRCLCGYRTRERGNWENVGYEFDCHLLYGDSCPEAEKQREQFPERFAAPVYTPVIPPQALPGIDPQDARKRSYGEQMRASGVQAFAAGAIVQRAAPCGSVYPSKALKERGIERTCTLNREHSGPHCHNGLTWSQTEPIDPTDAEKVSFTRVDCRCAACHAEWSDASKACPKCFATTITRKCGLKWSGAYSVMGEQEGKYLCQLPEGHSGTHTSSVVTWNAGPGEGVTATIHRVVEPVGVCDGSRMFAYDPRAADGKGMRLPVTCPGCRACS